MVLSLPADRRASALRRRVADTLARAGDADRADGWAAGERADCGPAAGLRRWFRRCPSPRTIAMEWRQQHDGEGATRCCRSSSWPRRRRSSASTSTSTDAKNRTYSLVLLVESGMVFCGPTRSARDARRRERRAARVFRVWASELEAFKFTLCCFRWCPASSTTSSSRPTRCDGSWRMALAKCCKSVANMYTHMHNIARPRAPSRLPYLGVYVSCLISPCWLWAADTWLGAAGLTGLLCVCVAACRCPSFGMAVASVHCCVFVLGWSQTRFESKAGAPSRT